MKKNVVLLVLVALIGAAAAPGWAAGPAQVFAADKDLIELLPRSTLGVLVLDIKRLLEVPPVAKALEGSEFKEFYDEFIRTSGIDLKRDVAYVVLGIPASGIASQLSMPTNPAAFKGFALVVGVKYDRVRLQALVKESMSLFKEEVYSGVPVIVPVKDDKPTTVLPNVLAELDKMTFQVAFLDDSHIIYGDEPGVKGVIDVYQKRAESLAQVPEMADFMGRVDKSGIAWSVASYPPEYAKMIADSNPLLKAIGGFKGMITAIDDKDSTLVVDIRTLGGTPEQNAEFASNLNGLKAVGALYAAEQPALAELLNGVAISSGEDYTRLNLTVPHETIGKLALLMEQEASGSGPGPQGEGVEWEALFKEAEDLGREGQFERAIGVGKQALRRAELKLGPDHPDLARVLDKIADLYREDGLPQEAEPLWSRSLAIREKSLGPDHPDLAESVNDLAIYYDALGKGAKAVMLYGRLLAIREKALGPEDPEVVTVLDKLARLHYYQREYAEAEPLWKRSLSIREKALGRYHPDVATNLHDLALLFQVQGKYAAAEPLWKRALAAQEKALGPDHPAVATTLGLLAELYRATKRPKEAEALEARAARIQSIKR